MLFSFFQNILSYIFCLFGYIKSDQLYPEPLSKTEEERYLREYFKGSKEAKNKLIEHNLRLVVHIAKKYTQDEQILEEYTSIGTIGLIKAINSFNENKGFKISTYASKCVENELLMHLRATKKNKAEISMNSIIGTDKDGNDMELIETLDNSEKDPTEQIHNKVMTEQMIEFINKKLSKRERDIMTMRYGLDKKIPKTQQEVANILNISRSYVSRIESKVQKILSKLIQEE